MRLKRGYVPVSTVRTFAAFSMLMIVRGLPVVPSSIVTVPM
jgi:hypothetical protein